MDEYHKEKLKAMLRDNISNCYRSVSIAGQWYEKAYSRIPEKNIGMCDDALKKYNELMGKDQLGDKVG